MSIPKEKMEKVETFSRKLTKDILTFCDEDVPEITISEVEALMTAVTLSIREQLSKRVQTDIED